jgi:hypothetical protein
MAPRIPERWIGRLPSKAVRDDVAAKLAAAATDAKSNERIGAQRLRVTWTGLAEVQYSYQGKDYVIWIPERADALPIAVEHPLPSSADVLPSAPEASASSTSDSEEPAATTGERATAQPFPGWLRAVLWTGGALVLIVCLLTWVVN